MRPPNAFEWEPGKPSLAVGDWQDLQKEKIITTIIKNAEMF